MNPITSAKTKRKRVHNNSSKPFSPQLFFIRRAEVMIRLWEGDPIGTKKMSQGDATHMLTKVAHLGRVFVVVRSYMLPNSKGSNRYSPPHFTIYLSERSSIIAVAIPWGSYPHVRRVAQSDRIRMGISPLLISSMWNTDNYAIRWLEKLLDRFGNGRVEATWGSSPPRIIGGDH